MSATFQPGDHVYVIEDAFHPPLTYPRDMRGVVMAITPGGFVSVLFDRILVTELFAPREIAKVPALVALAECAE